MGEEGERERVQGDRERGEFMGEIRLICGLFPAKMQRRGRSKARTWQDDRLVFVSALPSDRNLSHHHKMKLFFFIYSHCANHTHNCFKLV